LQKLWGNEILPEVRSTGTFPFPISSNWCENLPANRSFCTWTRIFVVNVNVYTCRHKAEYFKQAFISSAGVERGSTGNVCLKSPASNINAFPKLSATSLGRPSTTFFLTHSAIYLPGTALHAFRWQPAPSLCRQSLKACFYFYIYYIYIYIYIYIIGI
jgi:hypothetical protein